MGYDTRYRTRGSFFNRSFPSGVKWLIIANVAVFLLDTFGYYIFDRDFFGALALVPAQVLHGSIWQPVTYLFLHSLANLWHILFNMLALWMFGTPVEETWGTKRFLQYYFLCGIGAGVCVILAALIFGGMNVATIGASGAIYGLLLAFGMLFPNQEVLFSFLFPIKAKYLVMIYGAIAFISSLRPNQTVSNIAHLGGMIFGFLYIRYQFARRRTPATSPGFRLDDLARRWKDYKLQRAKRKFQVYMKKHGSGPLQ